MKQTLTLFGAIFLGIIFPWFEIFTPYIAPLLGIMMFFSFLGAKVSWKIFTEKRIYWIFFANISIGIISYFFILPFGENLAFIAFIVGMIPTALAAPALLSFLGKKTEFAIGAVFVTNFGIAFLLPFLVKYITGVDIIISEMMLKISLLLFPPLLVVWILRKFFPVFQKKILEKKGFVFYLWATIIIIAMARASNFMRENWEEFSLFLLPIAIISAVICAINFTVGYFLGGKNFSEEASQSLGQKNPMFMIWISLQFFSPLVALGPTFYIFFHHLVNGWKLWRKK